MASGINNQDPVSKAWRFIYCGSCKVMQKKRSFFAGSVASRTIALVVILAINKNRVLFVGYAKWHQTLIIKTLCRRLGGTFTVEVVW